MSKTLRTAGMVVAAVALVAATAGAAAPAVAATATSAATAGGIAGVSAATLTAIGAYGGLAAGVLSAVSAATAPGLSSQGSQTNFTTNPQSGLPYAMGRTRMSGLRIYANTNTRPGYTKFNDLLWFGALLSIGGQIDSIEKFTADNEVVTFDATGNANGTYRDYQGQKIHLGGSPMASALALSLGGGTAPGWTSQHKLSGITHAMWCLRYNKQGEMYGAGAPEPAWIGKWVKVYDPRLDSTYPGGSGSCRALQESTYVWSDNPGLHALTWALGRWQNGKRTCGIGAPVANIRVAEFVECANVCDANAWKVGGVEWTTDSKWDTLKRILQAGGAVPTQTAAMIGCLVSMPRTAVATIESRHLHDNLSIAATKSRRDRFNTVIPRYVDEDSDWSVISGTAVTVPDYVTADKGQRTKEIDFPLVQVFSGAEAKQPGQLAAYEIVNSREAGPWSLTVGPEFIGLQTGDVVNLNVPEEGLDNQPVLIKQRGINPATGKVTFTVETETFAKHAFALGETTTPPAPWSPTAPDLKPPAPVQTEWTVSGTTSGEGFPALLVAGDSEMPSADAIVIDYRLHTAGETPDAGWTNSAILSAVDTVRHVIAPLESQTAYDVRISYRVGTIDGDTTIFEQVVTGVGKITTIENQLQDQDEALAQLDADVAQAEIDIAAAQQTIAAVQADAAATQAALTQAQNDIQAQGDEILAAQDDIIANASAISTVSNTVSAQGSSITTLQQTVSGQAGSISTLQQTVSTQGGSITTLQQNVTTLQGSVSTLSQTVSTQGSTISQNSTAITTLQGNHASLSSTVSAQGSSITQLQTASSTQAGQIATLTTTVNAGGNPNLLPNGGFENGSTGWALPTGASISTSSGYGPNLLMDMSTGALVKIAQYDITTDIPLSGTPITVSCDARSGAADANVRVDIYCLDSGGATLAFAATNSKSGNFDFDNTNTQRAQFANTVTVPANTALIRVRCRGEVAALVAGKTIRFRLVKMERGSQWTPFTANASIVQSFTAISTLTTQYASLSTTVSTQGSSITTMQTAITSLQGDTATLKTQVNAGGGNLLTNTDIAASTAGWTFRTSNMTANGDRNLAGTNFQLLGENNLGIQQPNNGSTGYANWSQRLAITPGKWYDPSVLACAQACQVIIYIQWLDGNLGALGAPTSGAITPATGGTATINWSVLSLAAPVQAPPTAVFADFIMRKLPTLSGSPTSFAWFTRPQLAETRQGAATPLAYSPGSGRASIEVQATALSTLTTQYASLSTTVSTQGVTITSQQTAITTISNNLTTVMGQWGVELDVNGYVSGIKTNNNGSRADMTLRMDRVRMITPSGLGGSWQVAFDAQGRVTNTISDSAAGVTIELGYLA
ncbi:hypothetical protein [Novosphingobium sp.]|uniref:hypothetical protein n=1 Tax=Novosphingobium sp. TaxID=1874826 RepID=UPI0028B23662|nr:hypothetical protein [Novosphingobium sp.]